MLPFFRCRLRGFSIPVFVFLSFACSGVPVEGQDATFEVEDWRKELPISLSPETELQEPFPSTFSFIPEHWEQDHWHNYFANDRHGVGGTDYHEWRPSDFFDDAKLIQLAQAVTDKDIPKMNQLLSQGVDVNAVGKHQMTPLFWAFRVDDDPRPFGFLLEHGADPNYVHKYPESKRLMPVYAEDGFAITHMVAQSRYNRHFTTVFKYGGDPNLMSKTGNDAPSFWWSVHFNPSDGPERLMLICRKRTNLDYRLPRTGETLLLKCYSMANDYAYEMMLVLLDCGADHRLFYKTGPYYYQLIHFVAAMEFANLETRKNKPPRWKLPIDYPKFHSLKKWLEQKGPSTKEAMAEVRQWREWHENGQDDKIKDDYLKRLEAAAKESGLPVSKLAAVVPDEKKTEQEKPKPK